MHLMVLYIYSWRGCRRIRAYVEGVVKYKPLGKHHSLWSPPPLSLLSGRPFSRRAARSQSSLGFLSALWFCLRAGEVDFPMPTMYYPGSSWVWSPPACEFDFVWHDLHRLTWHPVSLTGRCASSAASRSQVKPRQSCHVMRPDAKAKNADDGILRERLHDRCV